MRVVLSVEIKANKKSSKGKKEEFRNSCNKCLRLFQQKKCFELVENAQAFA